MLYNEALELAKPTLKKVVDLLSEKNYKAIENIAELEHLTPELIKEIIDEYLELNELTHIDKYGVPCNFNPPNEYKQISGDIYFDNSGFWIDYDLTTDSKLNDLTLQMSFLFWDNNELKPILLDLHVM